MRDILAKLPVSQTQLTQPKRSVNQKFLRERRAVILSQIGEDGLHVVVILNFI